MDKFTNKVDRLINQILNEEIEGKVNKIVEEFGEGEWNEIEVGEELRGGQKKLDKNKNGKLDAEDFKMLRSKKSKKHGVDEDAEELSQNEPTYVGRGLADNKMKADMKNKIFGSFSDEIGWYDERDSPYKGEFDFDFDEEEFDEFEPMYKKYGKSQRWFAPGKEGERWFNYYRNRYGPMRIRKMRDIDEAETEEGNAFTGALAKAKEGGDDTFDVDGKTYHVKEEKKEKKWIQKTGMKKGALHKKLGVPEGDKIPQSKLKSLKADLSKKAKGDKKLSAADSKLLKQVNLALTLKGIKENKTSLQLSENELIDMIEGLVLEQKVKDKAEKENISKKEPIGLKKTKKAQEGSKKENQNYAKEVVKKMKDYLKDGSNGEFKENTEDFPKSNYQMKKDSEVMKYHPSNAVDEYIEAFAYPGMTNLVFDEIKPDDKQIDKYLKGDSTTGNAVKDKDGKALGNVVPSEVGERFKKNYDDNLYGAEQQQASYKRQPQPVDTAGTAKSDASLKSIRKGSAAKAAKIMNQLESTDKKDKVINEDIEKMKNLISYNRKTQ